MSIHNQFEVHKKGTNVEVGRPVPQYLGQYEASRFAAHLLASSGINPEDFLSLYRQIIADQVMQEVHSGK